jgi:hypothetical protein
MAKFWPAPSQVAFVLSLSKHERKILNEFTPGPVCPELVEGGTAGFQPALLELPENCYAPGESALLVRRR